MTIRSSKFPLRHSPPCSRQFNDRRMGSDVDGEVFGPEYKGYIFRITGGNDKQGFTMKQGILVNGRIRILMRGSKCHGSRFCCALHSFSKILIIGMFNLI